MPIIPALIVGGAAVAGAAISSKASKDASKAQTQSADSNIALQKDIYGQNKAALAPFIAQGGLATDRINALLGLGGNQGAAEDAFNKYLASTGYKFQLGQGVNAVEQSAVGKGLLNSGRTIKGLDAFGQGIGASYFSSYLDSLVKQQGVGVSGASALAGVSQNYGNSVANISQNAADAKSNAALVNGSNIAGLLGSVGNIAGRALGTSSYGGGSSGGSGSSALAQAFQGDWSAI